MVNTSFSTNIGQTSGSSTLVSRELSDVRKLTAPAFASAREAIQEAEVAAAQQQQQEDLAATQAPTTPSTTDTTGSEAAANTAGQVDGTAATAGITPEAAQMAVALTQLILSNPQLVKEAYKMLNLEQAGNDGITLGQTEATTQQAGNVEGRNNPGAVLTPGTIQAAPAGQYYAAPLSYYYPQQVSYQPLPPSTQGQEAIQAAKLPLNQTVSKASQLEQRLAKIPPDSPLSGVMSNQINNLIKYNT